MVMSAVSLTAGVVLVAGSGARAHLEVALLATQAPYDLAALAVDLVDSGGMASGDEQVIVMIYVYGVEMEVVKVPPVLRLTVGLLDADVIQAAPLEEHLSGLDVYLLEYPTHTAPSSRPPTDDRSMLTAL
jgi:hypothetical protein